MKSTMFTINICDGAEGRRRCQGRVLEGRERERKKREREVWPGLRDEEESSGLIDYMGSYGLCLGLMN